MLLNNIKSFNLLFPELSITIGILTLTLFGVLFNKRINNFLAPLTTLIFLILSLIATLNFDLIGIKGYKIFFGMCALDPFAIYFKIFLIGGTLFMLFISISSSEIKEGHIEYFVLVLSMLLGAMLLSASRDLIMMCVAFELVSIPAYLLTCFARRDKFGNEAALKYAIYGAVSTGIMLFGISLIYGLTHSTSFEAISNTFVSGDKYSGALFIAFTFILAGIGYKIAFVPFHFWSPDVYEGAPTPVTAYLSVVGKAAGFALLFRILYNYYEDGGNGVGTTIEYFGTNWKMLISVISAITMTLGNLSALNQRNLKRLLAYSSIAHAGYLLMGVATISNEGLSAVLLYFISYLFMNLGAFYILISLNNKINTYDIEAFRGAGWKSPLMGAMMVIFLISLTGLPPTFGFIGKFYIFLEVIKKEMYLLALIGIINTVISLYYYARIFKVMWLDRPTSDAPIPVNSFNIVVSIMLAFPTLLFGIFWSPIVRFVQDSSKFVF